MIRQINGRYVAFNDGDIWPRHAAQVFLLDAAAADDETGFAVIDGIGVRRNNVITGRSIDVFYTVLEKE